MPRRFQRSLSKLTALTELGSDRARSGESLALLAELAIAGVPVLSTAAWCAPTFREYFDKRQESEQDLGTLIRQVHRRGHRQRCYAAQRALESRGLNADLVSAVRDFAHALALPADAQVWIWTGVAANAPHTLVHDFGSASSLEEAALTRTLLRAFASAFDPELVRNAALGGLKGYGLTVALSVLPRQGEFGQLWLQQRADHPLEAEGAATRVARGRLQSVSADVVAREERWFAYDGSVRFDSAGSSKLGRSLEHGLGQLAQRLPSHTRLDFVLNDRVIVAGLGVGASSRTRDAEELRWVCVSEAWREVPCEASLSLLEIVVDNVVRPFFEELGAPLQRRAGLIEPCAGRLYFNAEALTTSLRKNFGPESRWLAALLGQLGAVEPSRAGELRFVLPRVFAALTLVESKLRTSVREFESRARQQQTWLQELDLAILPDDALRTTLRETLDFVQQTAQLYLQAKLGLARALTATTGLASLSDERMAVERIFAALRGLGDVASARVGWEARELSYTLLRDPATLQALANGASTLAELPPGGARAEVQRFLERHADHSLGGWDVSAPRLFEKPECLLEALALVCNGSLAERGRASVPPASGAQETVERIAAASSWLERRAIAAMLARAGGLVRVHEELRVWLSRCLGWVRKVLVDAERRLRRRQPELPRGAIWQLGLSDVSEALVGRASELEPLAELALRTRERLALAPPAPRMLPHLEDAAPELPSSETRLVGAFTGTGCFSGSLVRAASLERRGRPLASHEVLLCERIDGMSLFLAAHAGGVIAPLGDPLSELAVLARELGVPAVLGLGASIDRLADGERIFIDGERGVVERHG